MSDWGHAMFADDATRYGEPGAGIIDGDLYSVNKSDLINMSDIENDIVSQWNDDVESGVIYNYNFTDDQISISPEELMAIYDPEDIVDSAAAYDDENFTQWLWNRVLEPKDIKGVKTHEGGVVFDPSIIQKDYDSIVKQQTTQQQQESTGANTKPDGGYPEIWSGRF